MLSRRSFWSALLLARLLGDATGVGAASEWLSLGSKHWAPSVFKKSGIGTARAVAEARVTREEIQGWCANWSPDDAGCAARELATDAAKRTYRASADCTRGRITAVDGKTYTLDGVWDDSDVGAGRTRWRDSAGAIVGRDNASGGLGIAQQWEVLCPGPAQPPRRGDAAAPPPSRATNQVAGEFVVGQVVEAKYGRDWVRGRIEKVRQAPGAKGAELAYDVRLDNGQRGILPPRMVRKVVGR